MSTTASVLDTLAAALVSGDVRVVDLTQPLHEKTPVLKLPPPFANTPGLTRHEISRYDDRGPAWAWSWLEIGEHVGTHFDAPIHWISGKEGDDLASVPPERLVGPAVMIDKSAEAAANHDYVLTVDDVRAFEVEHGPLPAGGWLLLRTGWDARADDEDAFLNASSGMPRTPGPGGGRRGGPRRARAGWRRRRASSAWGGRPSAPTGAAPGRSTRRSPSTTT